MLYRQALTMFLIVVLMGGCALENNEDTAPPANTVSGIDAQQMTVVPPETLSIRAFEERRRAMSDGNWETRDGPIYDLEPTDVLTVGHGDVVIEFNLPQGSDEERVRSALHLFPGGAELRWLNEGVLQVRWAGSHYDGITPVEANQLPTRYTLRMAPRSRIGAQLLLGGAVNLTVQRVEEPLYSIVEVGDDAVRVPYYRPRRGYDLTRKKHTFELQFTKPMNMATVAEALDEQLGCTGVTQFEEIDEQTAQLTVMTEPGTSCTINPDGAADEEGQPVWFGMPLRYTIVPPVELLRGTLESDADTVSAQFQTVVQFDPGRQLAAVLRAAGAAIAFEVGYDDDVAGPASYLPWLYRFEETTGQPTEARDLSSTLGFVLEASPVPDTSEVLFRQAQVITAYDVEGDSLAPVFTAPEKHRIFGHALEPGGSRLAVLFGPVTEVKNRALHLAVLDLTRPETEPAIYREVGSLSSADWICGASIDLVWTEEPDQIAFVTYIKQAFHLALTDIETGNTRVIWDSPQLRRTSLDYRLETGEIVGISIDGQPVMVQHEDCVVRSLADSEVYPVSELTVAGAYAALQSGDEVVIVDLESGKSTTVSGHLVKWQSASAELWLYRWK